MTYPEEFSSKRLVFPKASVELIKRPDASYVFDSDAPVDWVVRVKFPAVSYSNLVARLANR